jgi:hypothetical protein
MSKVGRIQATPAITIAVSGRHVQVIQAHLASQAEMFVIIRSNRVPTADNFGDHQSIAPKPPVSHAGLLVPPLGFGIGSVSGASQIASANFYRFVGRMTGYTDSGLLRTVRGSVDK